MSGLFYYQNKLILKTKFFFYPFLLFLLLSIGFAAKASAQNIISGEIRSLLKGTWKLILEKDINRKKAGLSPKSRLMRMGVSGLKKNCRRAFTV